MIADSEVFKSEVTDKVTFCPIFVVIVGEGYICRVAKHPEIMIENTLKVWKFVNKKRGSVY